MADLKKKILCPYFGDFPPWMNKFVKNVSETISQQGYDIFITQDIEDFNRRCKEKLGFDSPCEWGVGKIGDYRSALGYLYEDEIKGFDYWGHCDFDVVFGDIARWFPDSEIEKLDVWSNHHSYVNGCWSLYKNCKEVNELFMRYEFWRENLKCVNVTGWVEQEYSRLLEQSGLKYKYSFHQGWPFTTTPNLQYTATGNLYQDGEEIPMFHFRRSKKWPI